MERNEELDDQVQAAAEEMQTELDKLEAHSEEVGDRIEETRKEWSAKQEDASVPGADSPADEGDDGGDAA